MPFGFVSSPHLEADGDTKTRFIGSPMPFGFVSSPHPPPVRWIALMPTGHQCLSALCLLLTCTSFARASELVPVTNAFRLCVFSSPNTSRGVLASALAVTNAFRLCVFSSLVIRHRIQRPNHAVTNAFRLCVFSSQGKKARCCAMGVRHQCLSALCLLLTLPALPQRLPEQ